MKSQPTRKKRPRPSSGRSSTAAARPGLDLVAIAGITLAVILAFLPVVKADFLSWDDPETILGNRWLLADMAQRSAHFWTRPHMDLYIPVTYEAWAIVASMASREASGVVRLDPATFHAANLALHVLAAILVYVILRRFFGRAPALCGALVFGLHPVQEEPVAWASGLKDVLSGLLALAAILAFPLGTGEESKAPSSPTAGRRILLRYVASTILFGLAVLAKPAAMTLPLVLLAMAWSCRGLNRPVLIGLIPWTLIAVACGLWTKMFQAARFDPPLGLRFLTAGHALGTYLWKLVFPMNLAVDYGYSPRWLSQHPAAWTLALVPLAAGWAVFHWRARARWVAGGAAVFVAALIPVLGFVPFDFQLYSTVADHYLYLPLLGVAIVAAWALTRFRQRIVLIAAIAGLAVLGTLTWFQAGTWHDNRTLFQHNLAVNERSTVALTNLAAIALDENQPREAEVYARRSLAVEPNDTDALLRLAYALSIQGKRDEALKLNRQAHELNPNDTEVTVQLGIELAEQGQLAEAIIIFADAVRKDPEYQPARLNYGTSLLQQNRLPEAQRELEEAVRLNPADAQARTNLALSLLNQGNVERARRELGMALSIDPRYEPAARMMQSLPKR